MANKYRKLAKSLAEDIENCGLSGLQVCISDWVAATCAQLKLGEEQETELEVLVLERLARGVEDFGFEQDLESLAGQEEDEEDA